MNHIKLRRMLKSSFRKRTTCKPTVDDTSELLLAWFVRSKSGAPFAIAFWRAVGDAISARMVREMHRERERDAVETWAGLKQVGLTIPTNRRWRTEEEQRAFDRIVAFESSADPE